MKDETMAGYYQLLIAMEKECIEKDKEPGKRSYKNAGYTMDCGAFCCL